MDKWFLFKTGKTNTNALIEMSLRVTCPPSRALRRGGRERSNLTENEIATPFGLAMTM